MAPHLYGPSITHMTSRYSGQALIDTINLSVGYLNKQGYCYQGKCTTWPIIVGETGCSLQDPGDTQFYTTLQQYPSDRRRQAQRHLIGVLVGMECKLR